jgi:hypothetical protein
MVWIWSWIRNRNLNCNFSKVGTGTGTITFSKFGTGTGAITLQGTGTVKNSYGSTTLQSQANQLLYMPCQKKRAVIKITRFTKQPRYPF